MNKMPFSRTNPYRQQNVAILLTIVALITIISAFVAGAIATGNVNSDSTPLISAVIGMVGPTILALLAFIRADQAKVNTDAIRNGEMTDKMKRAAHEVLDERENGDG